MAASALETTVITGADTAYYFGDDEKLVAVEGLSGLSRKIEKSKLVGNQRGTDFVFKCSSQAEMPIFDGPTEMVGKASIAVYAVTGPSLLIVLGVEDLRNVSSRMIVPMKPLDEGLGGACCCALKRCGPAKCCPTGCSTSC
jgi:hypothetical protein